MNTTARRIGTGVWAAMLAAHVSFGEQATASAAEGTRLNAQQLYEGYEATKVLPTDDGGALRLDPRVFKYGRKRQGIITTDPIDLAKRDGLIGDGSSKVESVDVEVQAKAARDASALVHVRSGAHRLDTAGWSDWTAIPGGKGTVKDLAGRYVQVRVTLSAKSPEALPEVNGLVLKPKLVKGDGKPFEPVRVVKADVRRIVRSPIVFHYERPDQKDVAAFRKAAKLDDVVKDAKDDFDKLVKLMDWVGSCHNDRALKKHIHKGRYSWDINRVFGIVDGKPTVYGHCMSYAEVMCYAAISMGYVSARHCAVGGFRQATHEVCDIWVPSLEKWVYFDPSLTSYYFDKKTKTPMSILETHDVICESFIPQGKDMAWFHQRRSSETYASVRKVGGKNVIGCRLGAWKYGKPMPANYNWGWSHSYLANGFVCMTPRNDFQSQPKIMPRGLGSVVRRDYPFWTDAKTPLRRGVTRWYTRKRDFYWTLDQASFNLVQVDGTTLAVELGQSMPFFDHFKLTVDGKQEATKSNVYRWALAAGENTLEVTPVDEFGKSGLSSSVTLGPH